MKTFADIESPTVKLLESDIDTDQIIPARFLRTASSEGLGAHLFQDRRDAPDFPLNERHYKGESILIAGENFGCGSSREHAPWALKDFGIRAIVSRSFADIFFNNCLINGLLPVIVDAETWQALSKDSSSLRISLREQVLETAAWRRGFSLDPFARYCLMHGLSELDFIEQNEPAIAAFEEANRGRIPSTPFYKD